MTRLKRALRPAERVAESLYEQGRRRHGCRELTEKEKRKLDDLKDAAGKTELIRLNISVPNGNELYAKCEFQNPAGSHYDRVYPELIGILLQTGFTPDRFGLVETSSGNASASFARACNAFTYESWVVLPRPEELSEARIALTSKEGAKIVHPDPKVDGYGLPGIARRMMGLIRESRNWPKPLWSPNHSMVAESLDGIFHLAKEIAGKLEHIDYFIGIPGNGTTLYGVGAPLKSVFADMQIIAVEPESNPGLYLLKYPHMRAGYEARCGLPQTGPTPDRVHDYHVYMPGSGSYGLAEVFPHIRASVLLVDGIRQIDDKNEEWDKPVVDGKSVNDILHEAHGFRVGTTSAASVMAALEIAGRVHDKKFVLIFYDLLEGRY